MRNLPFLSLDRNIRTTKNEQIIMSINNKIKEKNLIMKYISYYNLFLLMVSTREIFSLFF